MMTRGEIEAIREREAEIERLQTNWRRLKEYVEYQRDVAFVKHDVAEGDGARYFYGGMSGALTSIRDVISGMEWEGDEC
ncbi:hypothetical protein ABE354_24035 [Brevibacillus laterosporus]|uniref:hypothetical protein n=1 Tax=Brevibacillus laterosporus TaxID=1465 RepID=UPI003D21A17E